MGLYTQKRYYNEFYEFLISIGILLLATASSVAFEYLGVKELNIILIYLIGILLITIETHGYLWGSASCVLSILLFNFFFTQPKYTFQVNDPNYFISFFLFLVVAFIASTLVSRLQRHVAISAYNEKQAHLLYEVSLGYLNISGFSNILSYGITSLNRLQLFPAIVYPAKSPTELMRPYYPEDMNFYSDLPENNTIALWCLTNMLPCGSGTAYFNQSGWKYLPMKQENKIFGVAAFFCGDKEIDAKDMMFIDTIISQMALALQREDMTSIRETVRVEKEKEQLQDNMLRSLSHDLQKPLTSIVHSSRLMIENGDTLDKAEVLKLLDHIGLEANGLIRLTENLLSTTNIQDGNLEISKHPEIVGDIIDEAVLHMETFMQNRALEIHVPDPPISVFADKHLMVQVLVNLIDNAVKHTAADSLIEVSAYRENNYVVFEVSDNGGGIDPTILDVVFRGFVVGASKSTESPKGLGLGLSLCSSIVDAHDGRIMAFNNNNGGATFKVILPLSQND